jgi:5,5'-dehydrodivanillate O-demethylase oxygenase subunit
VTPEQNERLTRVSAGTPMGELLRRYWMPIAGVSEFESRHTKPIRLMGEDLVLYRDLSGGFGLIERHCPHRRADMVNGMAEPDGLRCSYHGWAFNAQGQCIAQPYEDATLGERNGKRHIRTKSYPVDTKGGMVWAYLGPQPAPCLPDWEAFSWPNGFSQIVLAEVPCNWLQCQENSIDPVHFEWMHENWAARLRGETTPYGPTHLQLAFEEFEHGFVYKRIKQDTDANNPMWTVGRVCLWPNGFFLGEHFEWRVPIDDENTLSVTWKFTRVPRESEPFVQTSIPTWTGPLKDARGDWISSHVMNQDFIAWVGQGRIADRSKELLGASDRGVVMIRRQYETDFASIAAGRDPKAVLRDASANHKVQLPLADRAIVVDGFTREQILGHPRLRLLFTTYPFQFGQPEVIKQLFSLAMGLPVAEFAGVRDLRTPLQVASK